MERTRDEMNNISEQIIGGAYTVAKSLGNGFLEKPYENALAHELRKRGLSVEQRWPIKIMYDGVIIGDYVADLLVENCIILELKVAKALEDVHLAQCLNYLKATGLRLCLLVNFGTPRVEIKRVVNSF